MGLTITDNSSGLDSGAYTLTILDLGTQNAEGANQYQAMFLAETNIVEGWRIDAFQIKLDTSAAGLIYDPITGPPGSTFTTYQNSPGVVNLLSRHNGIFPVNSFTGVYDATGPGVLLNGTDYEWVFKFSLTTTLEPQALQVLFYNDVTGKTTRLSQSLPEPGILILLGIAMSAIGVASWRIRKL